MRLAEGGNFVYCDRDGDVLKVGGENVSAREVEDVCRQVGGLADVAVVAQSHPMLNEVPVAFVIRGPNAEPDDGVLEKAIIEQCAANLADFKVPRAVYVVDGVPEGHSGQGGQERAPYPGRRAGGGHGRGRLKP